MVVLSKPAAGDTDWTTEINDNWTALEGLFPSICQGRLTLTSGTPVTTSDVTAATTIYFTPYKGNRIALYDGTNWSLYSFTERSLTVPSTTNTNYDIFIYDNAGTLTLEAVAWTNDTTRATVLVLQDGVYVKSGATARRYLGSFRTTGTSGQTEDSGDRGSLTECKRYVWNYYNRAPRRIRIIDSTDSWSYSTNTYRSWDNNNANRVSFLIGVSEDLVFLDFTTGLKDSGQNYAGAGIGLDSTSSNSADLKLACSPPGAAANHGVPLRATFNQSVSAGYHYLQLLEISTGGGATQTWLGDDGKSYIQYGASGCIWG